MNTSRGPAESDAAMMNPTAIGRIATVRIGLEKGDFFGGSDVIVARYHTSRIWTNFMKRDLVRRDIRLDLRGALREALTPMKTPLLTATAVALLALTACQSKTETTTVANSTTVANTTTAAAAPIELPPAIKSEGSFRCHGDNSLVKATFYEAKKDGSLSASVASPVDASPVTLSGAAGQPMTAEGGWVLSGNDKSFDLTQPGKPKQNCSK